MDSIIQHVKECYICGRTSCLEDHHIFFGIKNRENSEKYGLKVWLCVQHHRGGAGVHKNRSLDLEIKADAQRAAMKKYAWSIKDFINIFGRTYI